MADAKYIGAGGRGVATRRVAKKRGDRRPGSLRGGAPLPVARSAAQRRLGPLAYHRSGQRPKP